uniref:Uncharacterized protein n=1 Tax=Solanum lycopersicum TaxID=4081 RepID=A0A3Q7FZC3_SOLLC
MYDFLVFFAYAKEKPSRKHQQILLGIDIDKSNLRLQEQNTKGGYWKQSISPCHY